MSRAYCVNLIIDYYDSIVKTIDVYTEELLETIDPNKLADEASICEIIKEGKQPVFSGFEKYLVPVEPNYTPGVTKLVDYVNSIRQEMIDRVNKCQQDTLDFYHENRKEFEIDPKQMDTHKREELKKQLFGKSFCFLISTKGMKRSQMDNYLDKKCLFEMYLIVFDYYLDQDAIDYIRNIFGTADSKESSSDRQKKLFSDTRVLVYSSIYSYILDCLLFQSGHQHSIDIKLDQIMAKKDLRLILKDFGDSTDLSTSKDFDFSHLTKLDIRQKNLFSCNYNITIKSFGIYPNLTKLSLHNIDFENDLAFENLANIRHLNLKFVNFFEDCEFDIQKRMPNLEELSLYMTNFMHDSIFVGFSKLNSLVKLELIGCYFYDEFDFDSFANCNVTHLKIANCNLMKEFRFLSLPNLRHLEIKAFDLPWFNKEFNFEFQCESKLETLILQDCENVFLISRLINQFSKLSKLTRLDLIDSLVEPKKGDFKNLSSLRCLSLRDNGLEELEDGVFMGLENLEELDLRGNQLDETSLRQLDELKSLKKVKLDSNATP